MADMIKFFKGSVGSLPTTGVNGALYITTDEGGIYLGTGTGMKRLGDFVQVANVAALPTGGAHENCLYYCVAENILAKWNGTEWKQVNKQPTADEMKALLGLGSMAYKSEVVEDDLSSALKEKVNAAAEGNHSHSNKALLDTYTQTEANLADAVAKKHEHANKAELDKIVAGDKAKWDAVVADHLVAADKAALEDAIGDVNTALGAEVDRAKAAEKVNSDAIAAIKDGASIDSFADVESALAGKQAVGDYATKAEAQGYANAKDEAIAEAKAAGTAASTALGEYKTANDAAVAGLGTRIGTAETDIANLKSAVGEGGSVDEKIAAAVKVETDARAAAVKGVQDELDLFEETYATDKAAIEKSISDEVAARDAGDKAIEAKIGTVTAGKTVVQMIADAQAAATYDDTALAGRVSTVEGKVATIEGDYLKAADKTEVEGKITAEATTRKAADDALDARVTAVETFFKTAEGETLDEALDTLVELQTYITGEASAADEMLKDVAANKAAIQTLNADATTAGSVDKKIADAIAAENLAQYATDGDLAGVSSRVKAIEDKNISTGANKVEASATNGSIKIDGVETVVYTHPSAHAISEVTGLQDALNAKATVEALNAEVARADAAEKANKVLIEANATEIAKKANAADVYAKTETYSKTEIDALMTWGSF